MKIKINYSPRIRFISVYFFIFNFEFVLDKFLAIQILYDFGVDVN
jgi:hypothetical protein